MYILNNNFNFSQATTDYNQNIWFIFKVYNIHFQTIINESTKLYQL